MSRNLVLYALSCMRCHARVVMYALSCMRDKRYNRPCLLDLSLLGVIDCYWPGLRLKDTSDPPPPPSNHTLHLPPPPPPSPRHYRYAITVNVPDAASRPHAAFPPRRNRKFSQINLVAAFRCVAATSGCLRDGGGGGNKQRGEMFLLWRQPVLTWCLVFLMHLVLSLHQNVTLFPIPQS